MNYKKIFQETYLNNSVDQWIIALGVLVGLSIALFTLNKLFIKRFEKISQSTHNQLDDLVVKLLSKTNTLMLIIGSLYVGSLFLNINENITSARRSMVIIALLFQVAFWCSGIISYYTGKLLKEEENQTGEKITQIKAVSFVTEVSLWVIIILLIASNLGFNITTLIAGLGIGGIAVALALQSLLGDIIASLSIILDKPFEIGDYIVIGDLQGNVESIGLKTTRVKSLSGEQLVFSNNDLLQSRVKNYKKMKKRRVVFALGVVYDTSYEKLKQIPKILEDIINSVDKVEFERAHFYSYGDFSLDFEIVYNIDSNEYDQYMNAQQNINLAIIEKFREEGIEFAYPTQTLLVNKADNNVEIKAELRENGSG